MRTKFLATVVSASIMMVGLTGNVAFAEVKELTFWSHWAAEQPKRQFVEAVIRDFEEKNPDIRIKPTWYEKTALYAGLKTALRAGQAPDIFYAEPDQVEYIENDFLLDLSDLDWNSVEGWAKAAWTHDGKPYGLPLEAWTVELYYNTEMMADLGIQVPESLQFSPEGFLDMIKKARAAGTHPHVARRRRPSVSRRARDARGVAEDARRGRLWQAPQRSVAMGRPTRRRHAQLGERSD